MHIPDTDMGADSNDCYPGAIPGSHKRSVPKAFPRVPKVSQAVDFVH